jgi:RNA polymerase sigma-70 factor (ECF subfamily)
VKRMSPSSLRDGTGCLAANLLVGSEEACAHPVVPPEENLDFRAVFDQQSGYVWCTLRRLGVRDADLEDVCHEVFVSVHDHLASYDASRPLKAWLFGFALRKAANYRRRGRNFREVLGALTEPSDPSPLADEQLEREEQHTLVVRALASMTFERRSVIVMHEIEGFPMPNIARELGIPLNTAYSRLRLARIDFAKAVHRLTARGSR